jgi:hypothetical protein
LIVFRLLLRFLLVPLGVTAATLAAVAVVCFAQWNRFSALVAAEHGALDDAAIAMFLAGSTLIVSLSLLAQLMLSPALLGVMIAEAFAIRSWVFHALNGGLAAGVGWVAMEQFRKDNQFFDQLLIMVGAGIAAGFAYWAVAGWSAGFWKPVFAPPPPPGSASGMRT